MGDSYFDERKRSLGPFIFIPMLVGVGGFVLGLILEIAGAPEKHIFFALMAAMAIFGLGFVSWVAIELWFSLRPRKLAIAIAVILMVATPFLLDRLAMARRNIEGVINPQYKVVAWPGAPEFSGRPHGLVRVVYISDWDGTGNIQKLVRTDRTGLVARRTVFTYQKNRDELRICDERAPLIPALATECIGPFFSPSVHPKDLVNLTSKDYPPYFVFAKDKADKILRGESKEGATEEFPNSPASAYWMLR